MILRIRPALAIWYHQALNVVDDSEGPKAAELRYARLTGMREVALTDNPDTPRTPADFREGPSAGTLTGDLLLMAR